MRLLVTLLLLIFTNAVEAQTQASLRVVVPSMPDVLDPHKAVSTVDLAIAGEIFVGLVTRDSTGNIIPGIAESWDVSPDGLVYTFTIRNRAIWSDGRRVRARDFIAGFVRALDSDVGAPYAADLFAIQGAEDVFAGRLSPSDLGVSTLAFRRLRITLHRPSANFLEVLSRPIAAPMPRSVLKDADQSWVAPGKMIVNGAFAAVPSAGGLALIKNPSFIAAAATASDRIEFVVAENALAATSLVDSGAADLTLGFPFELVRGKTSEISRAEKGEGIYFVATNVRRPPLNDRGLRHALAMTINREALVRQVALDDAFAAYKMVPPGVLEETLSPRAPYAVLRSDMRLPIAEVLLAESNIGIENPKAFTLIYPTGDLHAAIAKRLVEAWAPLGVLVTAEDKPTAEYTRILTSGTFDMALTYWPAESPSPMGYLEQFSSNAGPRNITGYADPDFDQSLVAADSVVDEAMRPPFVAAAEGVLIQDQVIFPIFFYRPRHAVAARVQGWEANSSGIHPLRYLSLQTAMEPSPAQ